ncbi:MAG: CRTAC1 family protein [Planctomycetota bacterium]|nr:CRTAC1 family protein [Planctomycetota bacterium]MDA1163690.1 CRTAC1 family protein [Planctomycetota bacterium]
MTTVTHPLAVPHRCQRRTNCISAAARNGVAYCFLFLSVVPGLSCSSSNDADKDAGPDSKASLPTKEAPIHFRDGSDLFGKPVIYQSGAESEHFAILQSLGGGVAAFDFDHDGLLDLCFAGGGMIHADHVSGLPTILLRQTEYGFHEAGNNAFVSGVTHYSHGCFSGDYNNDGFPDVVITGYGQTLLWRNHGDGTFTADLAAMTDSQNRWTSSAGWGDVNRDGVLDLYAACYVDWSFENNPDCPGPSGKRDVCPPRRFDGLDDLLLLGSGDGTLNNVAATAGLSKGGKGLGVVLADFDHDNDIDIYVANDTTANFYYRNNGLGDFDEVGSISGNALDEQANANGSMGIAVSDSDLDGMPDLWVTNYEHELLALYRNMGEHGFLCISSQSVSRTLAPRHVSFGCVTADFDLDGDEDVGIANGHVVEFPRDTPVRQIPIILRNDQDFRFARVDSKPGDPMGLPYLGRGLAQGDFNRDGTLDLVVSNIGEPAVLALNETAAKGSSIFVNLIGVQTNRDAIGTRLTLVTNNGRQLRHAIGGGSYLSTSDRTIHFGIAEGDTPDRLEVTWPTGQLQTIEISSHVPEQNRPVTVSVIENSTQHYYRN